MHLHLRNTNGFVNRHSKVFNLLLAVICVHGTRRSLALTVFLPTALRKSADHLIDLVNMMGVGSQMPCYSSGVLQTTNSLRQRFQLQLSKEEAEGFVERELIGKSLGSYYTRLYDTFQYRTQGIY